MQKTLALFLQDARLSLKGIYFYMEVLIAVVFVAVMLFLVPENFERTQTLHVLLELSEPARSAVAQQLAAEGANVVPAPSRTELEQAMQRNRMSGGLVVSSVGEKLKFELVLQGHESERIRQLQQASLEGAFLARLPNVRDALTTTTLQIGAPRLSDKRGIVPIYLTMNVALMGLFIIAAYVFLDKEQGVIKALSVSPLAPWQYLASKMMVMLCLGLASALVVVTFLGGTPNLLWLVGLVVASNLFGSALGLLIASYFDSMVQAMEVLYTSMVVLMFAAYSYLMPAFSPWWVRILPTYSMLFAFRETLLVGGDMRLVLMTMLMLLLLGAVAFYAANRRYQRTIAA